MSISSKTTNNHLEQDESDDRVLNGDHFHVRSLIIHHGSNRRHVLLYHFLHWHDHDVPNSEKAIYDLLNRIDHERSLLPDTPILVHCRFNTSSSFNHQQCCSLFFFLSFSAGCGRTGSFIAIDLCRLLLRDDVSHLLIFLFNARPISIISFRAFYSPKIFIFVQFIESRHTFVNIELL